MVSYLDKAGLQHVIKKFRDTFYPVGSIFISTNSTSPAQLIGGTWTKFSQGRTLVGASDTDSDFTIGKTGGEKTHTLSIDEMPNHRHNIDAWQPSYNTTMFDQVKMALANTYDPWRAKQWTSAAGNNRPHNNLQPYISVWIWQRVN